MSAKPWKSEAILRLGLSLFLGQFLGALGLAVASYCGSDRHLNAWIFFALTLASAAACFAALFTVRKPWELAGFARQFLFLIFFVYLGLTFGAFVQHYAGRAPGETGALRAVVSALSFQGLGLIFVGRFLCEHGSTWSEGFGFRKGGRIALLYGVLAACLFLPVSQLLQRASAELMARLHVTVGIQAPVQALQNSSTWLDFVALGVVTIGLAPLAEEILFRGILYPAIKQSGFPRVALWVTSLLFAAIHVNLATFLPLLVLALMLTWLYEKTDNLLAPIAAHSLFNALNFVRFLLDSRPGH